MRASRCIEMRASISDTFPWHVKKDDKLYELLSDLEIPDRRSYTSRCRAAAVASVAAAAVGAYIEHRLERERQIVAAVGRGAGSVQQIVEAVYEGIDPVLIPAASAQVEVQLEKLISENRLILDSAAAVDTRVVAPD